MHIKQHSVLIKFQLLFATTGFDHVEYISPEMSGQNCWMVLRGNACPCFRSNNALENTKMDLLDIIKARKHVGGPPN